MSNEIKKPALHRVRYRHTMRPIKNLALTFERLDYAGAIITADQTGQSHMSHDLENNKIISAILIAGIIAMLAGFVASKLVPEDHLEKSVLEIDTSALESASTGGAPAGPEPILALLATADVAKGGALAKACLACHGFDKGGPNKIGPNLYDIVNNAKAHSAGFAYSDGLKEMASKGERWTYANLSAFLWKPAAYVKGTKMSYPGLKKPQDRANLIAYLRTLADNQAALPSETEIAAEAPKEEEATTEEKQEAGDAATEEPKKDVKADRAAPTLAGPTTNPSDTQAKTPAVITRPVSPDAPAATTPPGTPDSNTPKDTVPAP